MRHARFVICLMAGLLVWASLAPVEARRDERSTRREAARPDGPSLDEAVERVRRDTGGRVLAAEAREQRGRTSYRIKVLLPNGSVRVVDVDAQSGEPR
ncbi:MAG: PepSY domain-containing protein [Sulfuricaulis sp.]|nr:PepSY domain-containing protein [Sulfuricaulis sp.]